MNLSNTLQKKSIKLFWKVKTAFICFLFSTNCFAFNVITTDPSTFPVLQIGAEKIAKEEGLPINISYVKSENLTKYLKLGNKGDVLVSSHIAACVELSNIGLANPLMYKHIIRNNIYCIEPVGMAKNKQRVLLFVNPYHHATENQMQSIAQRLNSQLFVASEMKKPEEFIAQVVKSGVRLCGFRSMLNALHLEREYTKTEEAVNYYACPLIGTNKNAYKILTNYYEKEYIS